MISPLAHRKIRHTRILRLLLYQFTHRELRNKKSATLVKQGANTEHFSDDEEGEGGGG